MSPPTEQLIRDYLNRLSVAARGQLGPDDRRALVNRTRDFIERKTGFAGPPTALDVARLLSGLGDPAGLVQQERQRLASLRGEVPEPAAGRTRLARVLRRDQGKARSPSWHWPVQEGSRADLQLTLLDGAGTDREDSPPGGTILTGTVVNGAAPDAPLLDETASDEAVSDEPVPDAPAPDTTAPTKASTTAPDTTAPDSRGHEYEAPAGTNGTTRLIPAQPGEPSWFMQALGSRTSGQSQRAASTAGQAAQPEVGQSKPRWPSLAASTDGPEQSGDLEQPGDPEPAVAGVAEPAGARTRQFAGAGSPETGGASSAAVAPAWRLTMPTESVIARQVRRAARGVVSWYRRCPLEASAVVLLGIGGASYPPVWLLGAALALASRLWDYRDKWVGLALPLLLTVIGAAFGVTRGGHVSVGESVHEGWMYAVVISRIVAALGACYLAWRTMHGRRPPPVPPWNRPHKIG